VSLLSIELWRVSGQWGFHLGSTGNTVRGDLRPQPGVLQTGLKVAIASFGGSQMSLDHLPPGVGQAK